ncbi:MAG: 2-oxoglutarate dehydrogenase subunit E1, partial [Bdellovibrionota bacterium]
FLSSGEEKWMRGTGLTMLLPHGYEGQGPEHSSARLERFLQLCAQDNMQVVNLTTPAQIFHAMRRQVKRDFRKPLVIMSPKSLLRHPKVVSTTKELFDGQFQEVLTDDTTPARAVETLVLCSGKVYYDIMAKKEELGSDADKVAVVRVEQIYPFPDHKLSAVMRSYPNLKRIMWTQEEPKNMGAWSFVFPLLLEMKAIMAMDGVTLTYNGRTERASPATGSEKVHQAEQKEIVGRCFETEAAIASLKKAK